MNISESLKYRLLVQYPIIGWLNRVIRPSNWVLRLKTPVIIKKALANGLPLKLCIGSGRTRIDDSWLHADIHRGDLYVNIGKTLPFPDDSVDFIFSEHLIEHLPEEAMRKFWPESFRILKPGAWMRHSTPDLNFIVKLYLGEIEDVTMDMFYERIRHIRNETPHPCIYMNEILNTWGHIFNYDESYLKRVWADAGFVNIVRKSYGVSNIPELNGLEQHSQVSWVQNEFTLLMEAQKPKRIS